MDGPLKAQLESWLAGSDPVLQKLAQNRLNYDPVNDTRVPEEQHVVLEQQHVTPELSIAPSYPPLLQQLGNAAQAAGRMISAAVHGEKVAVSHEEQERRLAICKTCEHFDAAQGRCRICGCFGRWKAVLATEHCPDDPPRW